jgi:CHAT domain-containing protein/Tfp pilus assembly protein PilF
VGSDATFSEFADEAPLMESKKTRLLRLVAESCDEREDATVPPEILSKLRETLTPSELMYWRNAVLKAADIAQGKGAVPDIQHTIVEIRGNLPPGAYPPKMLADLAVFAILIYGPHALHRRAKLENDPRIKAKLYEQAVEISKERIALAKSLRRGTVAVHAYDTLASHLVNYSLALDQIGRLDDALTGCKRAVSLFRRIGRKDGIAAGLSNLGLILDRKGKLQESLTASQDALALSEELGNKDLAAKTLVNKSLTLRKLGRIDESMQDLIQAREIALEIGSKERECGAVLNLAIIYGELGKYEEAVEYNREALDLNRRFIHDPRREAYCLGNMAGFLHEAMRFDECTRYHEQALELKNSIGDKIGVAREYHNMASCAAQRGEDDRALGLLEAAAKINVQHRVPAETAKNYSAIAQIQANRGRFGDAMVAANLAVDYSRQARSVTAPLILAIRGVLSINAGELASGSRDLRLGQQGLEQIVSKIALEDWRISYRGSFLHLFEMLCEANLSRGRLVEAFNAIEEAKSRELVDFFARRPGASVTMHVTRNVVKALGDTVLRKESTLVEFAHLRHGRLVAFILTPDMELQSVDQLTSAARIDRLMDLANDMAVKNTSGVRMEERDLLAWCGEVYELLFGGSLESSIGKTDHLIIIPHKLLHSIPFEILYDGTNHLGIKYSLARSLSTGVLLATLQMVSSHELSSVHFGNPNQGEADNGRDLSLEKAEREAEKCRDMVQSSGGTAALYTQREASKPAFLREFLNNEHDLIHFAGHSSFDGLAPSRSFLLFSGNNKLTAEEICQLQARNHPIVILSSCQSGLTSGGNPRYLTGDEYFGLLRGLVHSGSPTQVLSNWTVSDTSAADMVTGALQEMLLGNDVATAVRLARIHVLDLAKKGEYGDQPPAYQWGSFMVHGDPSRRLFSS